MPRVTGLCVGNSPGAGEFPAQSASNAENVSIWWRHHVQEHKQSMHTEPGVLPFSRNGIPLATHNQWIVATFTNIH